MSRFPQVGDTVGRYRLTGVLGHGGMGVVFSAVSADLDRPVAVKVLAPQAALDPRLRERFGREAATLARLDSPHIVYVLEDGDHDGCPYLVTQLVPDGDLRRRLETGGALPPRRAADVVAQVAAALEEAHSHGIVHRDLKSANVLLRALPDGDLHAYLCDFGIARGDGDETTSSGGGVLGTLEYLAPERQSGAPASVATDVYSLGCLLWATLTGAPPYRGGDVDVALAHLRAPVPQLPGDDPASRHANAVVARAMAKDPTQRYSSAREMREELLRLRALATEQEPASAGRPGRPPRRRRTTFAAVVGAAVVATAVVLAVALRDEGPSVADRAPDPDGAASPTDATTSPQRVLCWDGTVARRTRACETPTGREGLSWVYPGFRSDETRCHRILASRRAEMVGGYFCPFTFRNPREGIRFSEWSSAEAARAAIDRDYDPWPEREVVREGDTWSVWMRKSGDENGRYSAAMVYRDWPFSAETVSNTPLAARLTCNFVEQRAPSTFELVQSLCRSPG